LLLLLLLPVLVVSYLASFFIKLFSLGRKWGW
jgi:hypothetical protein